jgi:predicted glutamine amidotransferase
MIAVYGAQEQQRSFLDAFKQLSQTGIVPARAKAGHKDGWGILIYNNGTPSYLGRIPTDPQNGSDYERAVESIARMRPQIILGHLRKASCGPNLIEYTQPFVRSQWSFAHNGTIRSPGLNRIEDENDSAAYFRTLLEELPSSNIEDALAAKVRKVRNNIVRLSDKHGQTYSSLTCLLSDGTSIYAVRDFRDDSTRNYYTMYYSVLDDGIVFCQEKIIDTTWEEIPNKTLVAFHPGENIRVVPCD